MGKQRKQRSADEKTAIVLATFKNETSVAEVARQYGVDESLVHTLYGAQVNGERSFWRAENEASKTAQVHLPTRLYIKENDQLKKVLGEKVLEVEILKKLGSSIGVVPRPSGPAISECA